jgi:hypothetical protein
MLKDPSLCEMWGCQQKAVATVHAQWTVVDFLAYESCNDHLIDMVEELNERIVDGQPAAVWWTRYDDMSEQMPLFEE